MKIKSTRTITVELDNAMASKLVTALSLALQGDVAELKNRGGIDALLALRTGLQDELAAWQE